MNDDIDLDAYLTRIGRQGPLAPDLATLAALHDAHVRAIPFESIDPLLGVPVSLDLAEIQDKLVVRRRGGYCFEQNRLFQAALERIGFRVVGLAGRVTWMSPPGAPLGPRTHMLLQVETPEGPYLADVGFGACLIDAPLRFAPDVEQSTALGAFQLQQSNGRYELRAKQPNGWRSMYVFTLEPQLPSDYVLSNWFTSTSPLAPFTKTLIMERIVGGRRCKLVNRRLTLETPDGEVAVEREITDADELDEALRTYFGITPPASAEEILARIGG
jgi:N-hydroxyarylamine O-acetyltransferase